MIRARRTARRNSHNSSCQRKEPGPYVQSPGFLRQWRDEISLLAVVDPVMPDLVRKIATEEAPYFFCPWLFAVEKPTRCKVVGLVVYREFLVGSDVLLWMVLSIA